MTETQLKKYLRTKQEERFCSGYTGDLPTGDGVACGTYLGQISESDFADLYGREVQTESGPQPRNLCGPCQTMYREAGLLVE